MRKIECLEWPYEGPGKAEIGMCVSVGVVDNHVCFIPVDEESKHCLVGYVERISSNTKMVWVIPAFKTFITNNYNKEQVYPIHARLFIENSILTTRQPNEKSEIVGVVINSPRKDNSNLVFIQV